MSEDEPLRLVEERNSSRNLAPVLRPVGMRLQFEGTSVSTLLMTAGTPFMPVVKERASLPAASWMALASSPVVGSA